MEDYDSGMSTSIEELTRRLLELIGLAREKEEDLTAFAGVRSTQKHGALAVVGQAPLGWVESFTPSQLRSSEGRERVMDALKGKNRKPKELNTPFWTNARAVAERLGEVDPGDDRWAGNISWTNLYRVSKDRGNPSPHLRAMQQALCVQLLWPEFLLWRPKRVLFMTGLPWAAPFVMAHQLGKLRAYPEGRFVKAVGGVELRNGHQPAIVVVEHPARKKGSATERAAEIADVFREIERSEN